MSNIMFNIEDLVVIFIDTDTVDAFFDGLVFKTYEDLCSYAGLLARNTLMSKGEVEQITADGWQVAATDPSIVEHINTIYIKDLPEE